MVSALFLCPFSKVCEAADMYLDNAGKDLALASALAISIQRSNSAETWLCKTALPAFHVERSTPYILGGPRKSVARLCHFSHEMMLEIPVRTKSSPRLRADKQ